MNSNFDDFSDEEFKRSVRYLATNEVVEAVVFGLDVHLDDSILAICGSGDIPLACVEKRARVVAVDSNPLQIDYVAWRLKTLQESNTNAFFRFIDNGRGEKNTVNRDYFSYEDRLSRIAKYAHVEFQLGDIFTDFIEGLMFRKIYLSNALGFCADNSRALASVASHLAPNGLLYITQDRFYGKERFFDLPAGLVDDFEQTAVARMYEKFWVNPGPTVLRKEK